MIDQRLPHMLPSKSDYEEYDDSHMSLLHLSAKVNIRNARSTSQQMVFTIDGTLKPNTFLDLSNAYLSVSIHIVKKDCEKFCLLCFIITDSQIIQLFTN